MNNIKNVVKVMNFHSLLRVDAAKREADRIFMLETRLARMMDQITNNRNFQLDKRMFPLKKDCPALNIYLGSDLGFCSNFNSQINDELFKDKDSFKILIGKKVRKNVENILYQNTKEAFEKDNREVLEIIEKGIREGRFSSINTISNHYENASEIYLQKQQNFPIISPQTEEKDYLADFVVEKDVNEILRSLMFLYIRYELQIKLINANAAENILRQNTTSESLKKIDERDEIQLKADRKEKSRKEFHKIIENFRKVRTS